jgi:hypothetical protein
MSSPRCRPTSPTRTLLALAACLLLAGCGGGGEKTAAKPTATGTPAVAHPHIITPANGDVIPATAELDTSRGAKLPVTGTAQPDTDVVVTTGCQIKGCSVTTKTDAQGRFSAGVSASTTSRTHAVTVTVSYEISEAIDSDRVIVTIGPAHSGGGASPPPRPRRKHHAHPNATPFPAVTVAPPAATAAPQVTAAPTTSGPGTSGSVVVIGDSLAQGMQPYLSAALPGWRVSVDARIGRPLAEGMRIFAGTPIRSGTVYAFSLFTNDDPRSVAALDAAVRQSVQRGGCAVWATIVRPAVGGVSYDAANRALRRLAAGLGGRLQLVDWAAAVAAHPQWVPGSDGVHSNAEGYRNRAALYAQAIQGCR